MESGKWKLVTAALRAQVFPNFKFPIPIFRCRYDRGARFGVNTSFSSFAASMPVARSFLVISVP